MAHCWARQPRARPSFPHLAGSCLHFVNWYVYHIYHICISWFITYYCPQLRWNGFWPGRGRVADFTGGKSGKSLRTTWKWKKWREFFTTQASLGRGETGEGEEQESKSGKEPSRVAEDKESTREPGVRGVSCNCQLWIRCRRVLKKCLTTRRTRLSQEPAMNMMSLRPKKVLRQVYTLYDVILQSLAMKTMSLCLNNMFTLLYLKMFPWFPKIVESY